MHRRLVAQIDVKRIGVRATEMREIGEGKRRVQVCAVGADSAVHGAVEIFRRPAPNPCRSIWGNVGGVKFPKRRYERLPSPKERSIGTLVAADAVSQYSQIATAIRRTSGDGG